MPKLKNKTSWKEVTIEKKKKPNPKNKRKLSYT